MKACGLIPAHAGSTGSGFDSKTSTAAHPRSRGEHSLEESERGEGGGSSPLTRGAPECGDSVRSKIGLIPAHAGSTC